MERSKLRVKLPKKETAGNYKEFDLSKNLI